MTVGIVGLGYVGLPLAIELARVGTRMVPRDVARGAGYGRVQWR